MGKFIKILSWVCAMVLSVCLANGGERLPAELIDLSRWKVTLPVSEVEGGNALEVKQPVLASYENVDYFFTNKKSDAVIFRAHCGGSTTKNSKYPRCELREMKADGKGRASWSTESKHKRTLTMRAAITKIPEVKKHVVCAQIHDSKNDLIMVRLEGRHLFIERNPFEDVSITRDYELGTVFNLKIEAESGVVKVSYNGEEKMAWKVSRDGCYFKAGCYTQSNVSKGDRADAGGEVEIYQLVVKAGE